MLKLDVCFPKEKKRILTIKDVHASSMPMLMKTEPLLVILKKKNWNWNWDIAIISRYCGQKYINTKFTCLENNIKSNVTNNLSSSKAKKT